MLRIREQKRLIEHFQILVICELKKNYLFKRKKIVYSVHNDRTYRNVLRVY